MPLMKENLLRWFPNHKSIWTVVGVENLGLPEMLVEIEAVAYDPQAVTGTETESKSEMDIKSSGTQRLLFA
jgi:hypothetical protein